MRRARKSAPNRIEGRNPDAPKGGKRHNRCEDFAKRLQVGFRLFVTNATHTIGDHLQVIEITLETRPACSSHGGMIPRPGRGGEAECRPEALPPSEID